LPVQGQTNSTEAAGSADSTAHGTQASIAKSGDVSTERKPGSLTNQQVPKNLTAADTTSVKEAAAGAAHAVVGAMSKIAAGSATGGAAGGAVAAAGSLDDAMPDAKALDKQQLDALAESLQNTTETLSNASALSSVKQQVDRVLQDGLNTSSSGDSSTFSGKSMKGSSQPAVAQRLLLDSARMSQLFGVFGALLVFGLWMRRRRRSRPHHAHLEPGLIGPGVSDQGIGSWLKPRHSRHRLAND